MSNKKKLSNTIMLITYPDSIGNNLQDLKHNLSVYFDGAVGGIHILPFFPSSGDRGFAPIDYTTVDSSFGTWTDIESLADKYYLMFDYMINHISARSKYYQDFLMRKDNSPYCDMFIRYKNFWQGGEPTAEQVDVIYKRKPRAPYTISHFADGTSEKVWCTFSEEQIDLNVKSEIARKFIRNTIMDMCRHGASIIRLDAFAYAVKKADTNCFFVEPDIWELLDECSKDAEEENSMILPEIHEHYSMAVRIEKHGYYVYDFALPMLLLNAIYYGQTKYLENWLTICPRHQFTTLDTHDGIGVVDVRGLLPDEEIDRTKEDIFRFGANVKKIYNTAAYNNLDVYQVNCTYYSALGEDDDSYLLARAVQFFAPGIPQVYYVGMLAGRNDLKLLEETKEGRNINRHYYSNEELKTETERPVVKKLLNMMRFRNSEIAFSGSFQIDECTDSSMIIRREKDGENITLAADFKNKEFKISKNGHLLPELSVIH